MEKSHNEREDRRKIARIKHLNASLSPSLRENFVYREIASGGIRLMMKDDFRQKLSETIIRDRRQQK